MKKKTNIEKSFDRLLLNRERVCELAVHHEVEKMKKWSSALLGCANVDLLRNGDIEEFTYQLRAGYPIFPKEREFLARLLERREKVGRKRGPKTQLSKYLRQLILNDWHYLNEAGKPHRSAIKVWMLNWCERLEIGTNTSQIEEVIYPRKEKGN